MMSDPKTSMEEAPLLYRKLCVAQALAVSSYGALLLLFTATSILGANGGFTLWLVQSVPLLIFVPGLIQHRHRTYSWLCFVILLYFTWSVTNLMSPFSFWRDWVVMILSVTLFVTAMMASRWLQHWQLWQSRQLS